MKLTIETAKALMDSNGGSLNLIGTGITVKNFKKLHNGDYEEGRYLYADGILTHVKEKKSINGYTFFLGKIPGKNVVYDGKHYAHWAGRKCFRVKKQKSKRKKQRKRSWPTSKKGEVPVAVAEKVLDIARQELGTKESPANSNKVKYNAWYYGREVSGSAYPWCMAFVQWVFAQAGVALPLKTASCGALMNAAKKSGQWVTKDYRPGDVVIYDFPSGAATDHTGIIEKVTLTGVMAIEGKIEV